MDSTGTEKSIDFKSLEIAYISKWNQVSNILNETETAKFAANRKIFLEKVFSEDDGNCETERYRFIHALLVKQGTNAASDWLANPIPSSI